MAFQRPYPRQRRTLEDYKAELEEENYHLRSELQTEVDSNRQNEKQIRELERECIRCEQEIQTLNGEIERLENDLKEEITELKSEISSLKKQLYQAKKDIRNNEKHISSIESQLVDSEEQVEKLRCRIRTISSRKNSPERENSPDQYNSDTNSNMATADLIRNINRGIDRIENHIRGTGTPIQNPANVIDGIRGSLNTVRANLQNITAERNQYQNLLNEINREVPNLRNQIQDLKNQHTNTYWGLRENWQLAQDRKERIGGLLRENFILQLLIQRKDTQIAEHRRNAHRITVRYNNDDGKWRRKHVGCVRQAQNWKGQYRNSQNQIQAQNQNIFNLQQQILALQNNPPQNMAAIEHVMQTLAPYLASLPAYDGQEPPDAYYVKLRNINEIARPMAVAGFDAVARTNNMKSKMVGRFHPVPAQNPYNGNNAINNEAKFLNWLQGKYRKVMIGTNRATLKALMSKSFHPTDTPESYEKRIKPFVQGMVFADVLPYLYDHILINMQLRIRITNPADLNVFFTDLRNIWLEAEGQVNIPIQPSYQASSQGVTSAEIEKLNSKIASLEAQLAESMQVHSNLAQRLQLPENVVNSNNASIFDSYINQELEKRLGVIEINLAKLTKLVREDTKSA